jgi:hypothetical protein
LEASGFAAALTDPIGGREAPEFTDAAALASSTTLESLDLTDNALGRSSEAMDQWHLDERNVSACPVLFLVQAVRQNVSLRLLQLRANHIVGDQEDKLREAWLSRGAPAAGLVL